VHVIRPGAGMPSGNFFQLKGTVLDKMRSDFNHDKRDRFARVFASTMRSDLCPSDVYS
jgi:hypothetical protein